MSAYKYYTALKASSGTQVLPADLKLHNDNAVAITLEITPTTANSIYNPLSNNKDIVGSIVGGVLGRFNTSGNINATSDILEGDGNATITVVSTLGDIDSATIVNEGDDFRGGMTISTIVDDVNASGINKGFDTASVVPTTPVEAPYKVYSPSTAQGGTGFQVGFSVNASAQIENVTYVSEGTGYEATDSLIFAEGQNLIWTLVAGDLGVNTTIYFDLVASDIANDTFPLKLNIGESTDFLVSAVKVEGTNNRTLLAYSV